MAEAAAKLSSVQNNFVKNTEEFENIVKNKLKWSKKVWIESGENGTRLNKLCNSINYWKVKLKPAVEDVSIVITIFNTERDTKIELINIILAIEALHIGITVQGFSEFRNPRYICLYFKNKEERYIVKQSFKMLEDNYVVYLSWAFDSSFDTNTIKVHWLPITINLELIKSELDKFIYVIEEERKIHTFMSGRNMPCGKVAFKAKLNKGINADDIPHLINVSGMEALVTVSGRRPLCLNCNILGHISKECKLRFCTVCNSLKEKKHNCDSELEKKSYASIVKASEPGDLSIQPDDWGAAVISEENSKTQSIQDGLSEKIASLEKQIMQADCNNALTNLGNKNGAQVNPILNSLGFALPVGEQNFGHDVFNICGSSEHLSDDLSSDEEQKTFLMDSDAHPYEDKKEGITEASVKIKKRKRKQNLNSTSRPTVNLNVNNVLESVKLLADKDQLRSYGKPNPRNARRIKEEAKFDKLKEKREFVFK